MGLKTFAVDTVQITIGSPTPYDRIWKKKSMHLKLIESAKCPEISIPYAYIAGSEVPLLRRSEKVVGNDLVFQVLTTLRARMSKANQDPLGILDEMAMQFGLMPVSDTVAVGVEQRCQYPICHFG